MSFFYLSPVKGDMLFHMIETVIVKRLEYLHDLINNRNISYNEYVVDGSVYDNVGHFMLTIVSILCENKDFSQFVLKGEIELFKRRLKSLTAYDMRCFSKKMLRNIRKYECTPPHLYPLQLLCQHLVLKNIAQHICIHHRECSDFNIKVNFKDCLLFVSRREVELHNGTALIPCSKWKHYLTILFSNNMKYRLQNTNLIDLKCDPRILELLQKIKQKFFMHPAKHSSVLLSTEVDDKSMDFPPCMYNLHVSLRKKHRLSHNQRFYYSLFLKDIGMSVEEAVLFWSKEYRQNPNGTHSCCHNWEKDEKKYLYGIRHMYGMEGGRKSYTSVDCKRIQSIENACTEGGCPFKTFDNIKMVPLLKNCSDQLVSQVNYLKRSNQFTDSCLLYLKSLVKNVDCDTHSFNFSPVKYYMIAANR